MKKFILPLILSILIVVCFSQNISGQELSHDYLKKSKNQKTAAKILAIGGTTMVVAGIFGFNSNWENGSYTATDISGFIMLGGGVALIASIPLFIISSVNKKSAFTLAIINHNVSIPIQKAHIINTQPALTLTIDF